MLRAFPGDHAEVVAALSPTPRLQYLYLKAAMQVSGRVTRRRSCGSIHFCSCRTSFPVLLLIVCRMLLTLPAVQACRGNLRTLRALKVLLYWSLHAPGMLWAARS